MRKKKYFAGELIMIVCNPFVWMTTADVLELAEYMDENVSEVSIKVGIWKLVKAGKLEKRSLPGGRKNGFQVKKPFVSDAELSRQY